MMSHKNDNELVFLPLGGTGEIGMNCNLYGYGPGAALSKTGGQWIMVDLGVTFGRHSDPGIDVITPDIAFIEKRRKNLLGLLLTHGHEDHIGAVAHLWPRLKCPVYATPFTAALVRGKLAEAGLLEEVPLHIIEPDAHLEIGPFSIDYICLTHSIAEPSALAIEVEGGRILHTGDWKIDPDPVIGKLTEVERLKALGDAGIDAIICDSTNVLTPGRSGSEADVGRMLGRGGGRKHGPCRHHHIRLQCGAADQHRRRRDEKRKAFVSGRSRHAQNLSSSARDRISDAIPRIGR
jgi:ribonuclease J